MNKKKLFSRFGLEITNIDVTAIQGKILDEIVSDLARYGLLLFPKQVLEDRDLYAFSQKVGDGRLDESARKISFSPSVEKVNYLTNLKDSTGKPIGFPGNHTDFWHSDQEFRENPATLGLLYCVVPSPVGGTTSFASTDVSNLDLLAEIMEKIQKLKVTYIPAKTHDNVRHVEVIHPLLLTRYCGKKTVYISQNSHQFIGLKSQESELLKKQLLAAILNEKNIYSHQWKMGDLILYDNTQLIHRRDEFQGIRWLKSTKIFARKEVFAVPDGEVLTM